jgi:CDP-diacylglycerol---serine O-phosphatidyltransferase
MVAAVVYAEGSTPLTSWIFAVAWLAFLGILSFLMISTWRYPSFKDLSLTHPRSPMTFVVLGTLIYLIWNFSQPVLLAMSVGYVSSGIIIRIGGIVRRYYRAMRAA